MVHVEDFLASERCRESPRGPQSTGGKPRPCPQAGDGARCPGSGGGGRDSRAFSVSPVKDKEDTQVDSEARPMKDETFGEYR